MVMLLAMQSLDNAIALRAGNAGSAAASRLATEQNRDKPGPSWGCTKSPRTGASRPLTLVAYTTTMLPMPQKPAEQLRADVQRAARENARSCLLFRVRALSRTLTALYEVELRPLGLKASQMSVMTAVAAKGEERLSTLADQIALEPSSLSRVLDVMRRNGWVETVTDPDDERARLVRMTDAGNALYAEAGPLWRKAQARARKLLGREDAEVFAELANRSLSRRAP